VYVLLLICPDIFSLQSEAYSWRLLASALMGSSKHILHRVHFLQARILQQAQPGEAKIGVEDIDHVTRSVSEAA
jgi:hypothetical protein